MAEPQKSVITNNALFTDFYELTMAQGYWKNDMNHEAAAFQRRFFGLRRSGKSYRRNHGLHFR